jgi:hypothetical protein
VGRAATIATTAITTTTTPTRTALPFALSDWELVVVRCGCGWGHS